MSKAPEPPSKAGRARLYAGSFIITMFTALAVTLLLDTRDGVIFAIPYVILQTLALWLMWSGARKRANAYRELTEQKSAPEILAEPAQAIAQISEQSELREEASPKEYTRSNEQVVLELASQLKKPMSAASVALHTHLDVSTATSVLEELEMQHVTRSSVTDDGFILFEFDSSMWANDSGDESAFDFDDATEPAEASANVSTRRAK